MKYIEKTLSSRHVKTSHLYSNHVTYFVQLQSVILVCIKRMIIVIISSMFCYSSVRQKSV